MVLLSIPLLIAGYTLVYAGVTGKGWASPWLLLMGAGTVTIPPPTQGAGVGPPAGGAEGGGGGTRML